MLQKKTISRRLVIAAAFWLAATAQAADVTVTKTATPASGGVLQGGTINYTVTVTNSSSPAKTLNDVAVDDPLDPKNNTVFAPGSLKVSPVAINDTFSCTGNVSISIAAPGVLSNDYLGVGSIATVTAFDAASINGGTVSVTQSGVNVGAFTYDPPRGFTGTDTFTYTLQNATGSTTATVNIVVSNMIWFIDNSAGTPAAGVAGRLSSPYDSLAAFIAVQGVAGNNPKAGDAIYIFHRAGNYPLSSPAAGLTLLDNQRLIGQGVALDSTVLGFAPAGSSVTLPAAVSNPTITNSGGAGITLNSAGTTNFIKGLTVGSATTTAIVGSDFGTLTISQVSVSNTAGGGSISATAQSAAERSTMWIRARASTRSN